MYFSDLIPVSVCVLHLSTNSPKSPPLLTHLTDDYPYVKEKPHDFYKTLIYYRY